MMVKRMYVQNADQAGWLGWFPRLPGWYHISWESLMLHSPRQVKVLERLWCVRRWDIPHNVPSLFGYFIIYAWSSYICGQWWPQECQWWRNRQWWCQLNDKVVRLFLVGHYLSLQWANLVHLRSIITLQCSFSLLILQLKSASINWCSKTWFIESQGLVLFICVTFSLQDRKNWQRGNKVQPT